MLDFTRFSMQNEQPGTIAPGGWLLRNEAGRQIEMEIGGSHGGSVAKRGKSDNSQFQGSCE